MKFNQQGQVVGDLAERWEVKNQGKTYSFKLRKSHFSNGEQVTSQHIAQVFHYHLEQKKYSFVTSHLKDIIDGPKHQYGVEIIDRENFKIHLKKPYPSFILFLTSSALSISYTPGNYEIGSGELMLEGPFQNKEVVLVNNPHHHNAQKKKKLLVSLINTKGKKINEIEKYDVIFGANLMQTQFVLEKHQEDFTVDYLDTVAFSHIYFNMQQEKLKDFEYRKYVYGVFDHFKRGQQRDNILYTYFTKGILSPSYYLRKPPSLSPHQKFASKLKLVVRKDYYGEKYMEKLVSFFKKYFINLNVKYIDVGELLAIKKSGRYDLLTIGYMGLFPAPEALLDPILGSNQNLKFINTDLGDFAQKAQEIKFITNRTQRIKTYEKTIRSLEEQYYFLPHNLIKSVVIHRKKIHIPKYSYFYHRELLNISWKNQ